MSEVSRKNPCAMCGGTRGDLVATVAYWDLVDGNFLQCPDCYHVQLDPMLSAEQTSLGCQALHHLQSSSESVKSKSRGYLRAFSKGIALGMLLRLKRAHIDRILELGPGDGFVGRGVQVFFPGCAITALDVVPAALKVIHELHGFATIVGTPEDLLTKTDEKYDLVIARDILEHTFQPAKVIQACGSVLRPGGFLHFITPNGKEDVWGFRLRWKNDRTRSELHLNHVHYFDPVGLKKLVEDSGFSIDSYYLYSLKWSLRGRGWKHHERLVASEANHTSAEETIAAHPLPDHSLALESGKRLPQRWWASKIGRWFGGIFWSIHHLNWVRLPARWGIGHEIFALAKRRA